LPKRDEATKGTAKILFAQARRSDEGYCKNSLCPIATRRRRVLRRSSLQRCNVETSKRRAPTTDNRTGTLAPAQPRSNRATKVCRGRQSRIGSACRGRTCGERGGYYIFELDAGFTDLADEFFLARPPPVRRRRVGRGPSDHRVRARNSARPLRIVFGDHTVAEETAGTRAISSMSAMPSSRAPFDTGQSGHGFLA